MGYLNLIFYILTNLFLLLHSKAQRDPGRVWLEASPRWRLPSAALSYAIRRVDRLWGAVGSHVCHHPLLRLFRYPLAHPPWRLCHLCHRCLCLSGRLCWYVLSECRLIVSVLTDREVDLFEPKKDLSSKTMQLNEYCFVPWPPHSWVPASTSRYRSSALTIITIHPDSRSREMLSCLHGLFSP